MKKHRLLSTLLSAALMIVGIAAPLPQKVDISIDEEMAAYAAAYQYYTDENQIQYRIYTAEKTADVTAYLGWDDELVIPETVNAKISDTYEIECTVTAFTISDYGRDHGNVTQIKKITIPGTIKNCGRMFHDFGYYKGWSSLEEIVLCEGVESIGNLLFYDSNHVKKVTIPSTVKSIENMAFAIDNPYYTYGERGEIICGYTGTIAEKYANAKSIPFVSLGDPPSADTTTPTTPAAPSSPDLELSASSVTLKEGDKYTITANQSDLTYKSNNTDVAVVSKNGVVTAIGQGSAMISVINSDGDVAQLKVTVTAVGDNFIIGDCNHDGKLSIADVLILQKWLLSAPDTELDNWKAADLCEDGIIDVYDLILLRKLIFDSK